MMKNDDKGDSSFTENEDNLDYLRLSMESANDTYQNAVKNLSDMQEKYRKQKKNMLLVRRQSISCIVQGMIGRIYTTVLMLKAIYWNKCRVFKVEKILFLNIHQ